MAKRGRPRKEPEQSVKTSPATVDAVVANSTATTAEVVASAEVVATIAEPIKSSNGARQDFPPHIAESRKALDHPLQAGQAFFEAPDGHIIVAESDRPHVWYRQGNNGEGMWINPRR